MTTIETNSNEEIAKIKLVIDAGDPNTEIEILDANIDPVPLKENLSEVEVELNPGLYTVNFRAGDAVTEKDVILRPGSATQYVNLKPEEAPRFKSAAPLQRTSSSREVDQALAESLSRSEPVMPEGHEGGSHLLLFVRDPRGGEGRHVGNGLDLRDRFGNQLVDFASSGRHVIEQRQSGIHVSLNPGSYCLGLELGNGIRLEQVITTAEGWQTQIFLTVDEFGSGGDNLLPSLWDMSVLFSRAYQGFEADSPDARYTELALLALEGTNSVPAATSSAMFHGKFENPMLGILALHLHLRRKKINPDLVLQVLDNLFHLIGPVPDIVALAYACYARLDEDHRPAFLTDFLAANTPLDTPPMLRASWRCLVEASHERPDIIRSGSLADEISGCLVASGAWLVWRGDLTAPTSEVTPEEIETYSEDSEVKPEKSKPGIVSALMGMFNVAIEAFQHWSLEGAMRMLSNSLQKNEEAYELLQSAQFSEAERRVAYFVRPTLEPSLWDIMKQFPALSDRFEKRSSEGEKPDKALVNELEAPVGTALRICMATWWKATAPVMPNKTRIDRFVKSESHDVNMLSRIMRSLEKVDTGLIHPRLERRVNGLEMLYLRYRNSPMLRKKSPAARDLAALLNDAGYRMESSSKIAESTVLTTVTHWQIGAMLGSLRSHISARLKKTRSQREIAEEILACNPVTALPGRYRRGHLFPSKLLHKHSKEGSDAEAREG